LLYKLSRAAVGTTKYGNEQHDHDFGGSLELMSDGSDKEKTTTTIIVFTFV